MAIYDEIIANKPEILQCLVNRIRKRHSAPIPDGEPVLTPEQSSEQAPNNGEGSSLWQWGSAMPLQDANEVDNDEGNYSSFLDLADFDLGNNGMVQGFENMPSFKSGEGDGDPGRSNDYEASWNKEPQKGYLEGQREGYKACWNDGHEKGYLDGHSLGYKAGRKAVEQGQLSAFQSSNFPNGSEV